MKTIVNIVSEQTLPNYLFVKEVYEQEDNVIWIVSKADRIQTAIKCLKNTIGEITDKMIYIEDGSEENIQYIKEVLQTNIDSQQNFVVNLTGGTKIMALAVYDFFRNNVTNAEFYYIPFPKNIIIDISSQNIKQITYRISVEEYLKLYNLKVKSQGKQDGVLSFKDAKYMYSNMYNLQDNYLIELEELRELKEKSKFKGSSKNKYKNKNKSFSYNEINNVKLKDDDKNTDRAKRIKDFILNNNIPTLSKEDKIGYKDIVYITGGWFEDFIFYLTKEIEKLDDIVLGMEILKQDAEQSKNELDVVYTKDNKFFIRECKTGFEKESMFNDIVYTATAIKSLFGLSTKSSVYCYREKLSDKDDEQARMNETLNKMGITYFGKKDIDDELNKLN